MDSTLPEKETTETTTTAATSGTNAPTTKSKRGRSEVWDHFDKVEPHLEKRAKCKYCGELIKYQSGTTGMWTHLTRCLENPNREKSKRRTTSSNSAGFSVGPSPTIKFDQKACQMKLVKLFVKCELPFRFAENEDFCDLLLSLQPRFEVRSRFSLRHDILELYDDEKKKLKNFLSMHCGRVCLTTDTWTSIQNISYMTLTAHFVDNDWKLQKKILNFCQITGHSGEFIAKKLEACLSDWELKRVLTITVDNATSNDVGIQNLKKRMSVWNCLVLKGEYVHTRCCAHILNLVVRDGLKEYNDSILRIRNAVKYVKSSPSRLAKFKGCVQESGISCKSMLCLDVETRWNSTYLMLEAALQFKNAFVLLDLTDKKFGIEMSKKISGVELGVCHVPFEEDWEFVRSILPFLKMFYDSTMRISGSSYVTSHMYMKEVFGIGKKIQQNCESSDESIKSMAIKMKAKYDKYWGSPFGLNMLLLIADVLDPRSKLGWVDCLIDYIFEPDKASQLKSKLLSSLKALFEQYQGVEEGSQSSQQELQQDDEDDDPHCMDFYLKSVGHKSDYTSELDKYLGEVRENYNKLVELDLLQWWKVNSTRFPVLASTAREVLAIPVSTVASECAFSTGGRVVSPYLNCLAPKIVEALICTQDWLKGTSLSKLFDEDCKEIENFEQEATSQDEVAPASSTVNLGD